MAGLLAARMLRHLQPTVLESQPSLPHNHSAVLRFASPLVGDVLGLPFKKVLLTKTVIPWRNPVADAMAYSYKVLGQHRTDRSVLLPERWLSVERWIAPQDLISRMAEGVDVKYSTRYGFPADRPKVISTIPMPHLMKAMAYERDIKFSWVGGANIRARLSSTEAYCSVMVPDPAVSFYRASVTGDLLTVETALNGDVDPFQDISKTAAAACRLLGLSSKTLLTGLTHSHQDYAKITPIDEAERKAFIYWASTVMGRAYQLGRYATWRPGLQLDDLVKDIRIIEQWIKSPSESYDQQHHERRRA